MQSETTARLAPLVAQVIEVEGPSTDGPDDSSLAAKALGHVRTALSNPSPTDLADVFAAVMDDATRDR